MLHINRNGSEMERKRRGNARIRTHYVHIHWQQKRENRINQKEIYNKITVIFITNAFLPVNISSRNTTAESESISINKFAEIWGYFALDDQKLCNFCWTSVQFNTKAYMHFQCSDCHRLQIHTHSNIKKKSKKEEFKKMLPINFNVLKLTIIFWFAFLYIFISLLTVLFTYAKREYQLFFICWGTKAKSGLMRTQFHIDMMFGW